MKHDFPGLTHRAPPAKILLIANSSWNVVNFRGGLIRGLVAENYELVIAAPRDRFSAAIEAMPGCRYVELPMSGRGRSPVQDLALLRRLVALFRSERPSAFLGFTVKPNVFGSIAARMADVPAVNNIAGRGTALASSGAIGNLLIFLYRNALRESARVFFQNPDDRAFFLARGMVRSGQDCLLPGSGIDIERFRPPAHSRPVASPNFTFLMLGRLLREKGVAELAAAARILRARSPSIRVLVMGPHDADGAGSILRRELNSWIGEDLLQYLGEEDDVRPALAAADCVVLPSYYREGTPRSLLEAAAMGKPIITTDTPGCREIVEDGVNGYLVPPRDADALANAMRRMAASSAESLARMGRNSGARAERFYDERIVIDRYLDALSAAIGPRPIDAGAGAGIANSSATSAVRG